MKKRILWFTWTEKIPGYQVCSGYSAAVALSALYRMMGLTSLTGWMVTTESGEGY